MKQLAPNLYLGHSSEFGDASVLAAAGVELAIHIGSQPVFPHSADVVAVALQGVQPWAIKALAGLLTAQTGRVVALCDAQNGTAEAAFLALCREAERRRAQYDAMLAWLRPLMTGDRIPERLHLVGRRLWP